MKRIVFVFTFALFPLSALSGFGDLQKGVAVTDGNLNELAQTSWEYAKASTTQEKFGDGFARAFLKVKDSNDLYSLSGSGKLYLTDSETREVLGHWPLTRWENEYIWPALRARYKRFGGGIPDLIMPRNAGSSGFPGCFVKSPLRFGDLDGDSVNELVLFIGNDLLVFSPEKENIIFGSSLSVDDWMSKESSENYYELYHGVRADSPQYQSVIASNSVGAAKGAQAPGYRGHSKLFFGDFDDNGKRDIVVWKKLYESLLRDDPNQGFRLIEQRWLHYEARPEGYHEGDVDEETIRSWLSEDNLRWPDGFPSESECEGEQGQLIPEMHDPLLNDPEVLP